MGEAVIAVRSASEIELISIVVLGKTDARWRPRAVWVKSLNNLDFYIYFCNACARDASSVVSLLEPC